MGRWIIRMSQGNHKAIMSEEGRKGRQNQRDSCLRWTQPDSAGFEDGGRGHGPRNAGTSESWQRQGTGFYPRASRKEQRPAHTLTLAQGACLDI